MHSLVNNYKAAARAVNTSDQAFLPETQLAREAGSASPPSGQCGHRQVAVYFAGPAGPRLPGSVLSAVLCLHFGTVPVRPASILAETAGSKLRVTCWCREAAAPRCPGPSVGRDIRSHPSPLPLAQGLGAPALPAPREVGPPLRPDSLESV